MRSPTIYTAVTGLVALLFGGVTSSPTTQSVLLSSSDAAALAEQHTSETSCYHIYGNKSNHKNDAQPLEVAVNSPVLLVGSNRFHGAQQGRGPLVVTITSVGFVQVVSVASRGSILGASLYGAALVGSVATFTQSKKRAPTICSRDASTGNIACTTFGRTKMMTSSHSNLVLWADDASTVPYYMPLDITFAPTDCPEAWGSP